MEAEEATGFNPSGFGDHGFTDDLHSDAGAGSAAAYAIEGDLKSSDGLTTATGDSGSHSQSASSGASSKTSVPETPGIVHVNILDNLTVEEKERRLAAMFVCLKPIDVKLALKKNKGDADLAIDELLNLHLLEQTGQRPKGVDGFYVSDDDVPKAKKRARRKTKKISKAAYVSKAVPSKGTDMVPAQEGPDQEEAADNGKWLERLSRLGNDSHGRHMAGLFFANVKRRQHRVHLGSFCASNLRSHRCIYA